MAKVTLDVVIPLYNEIAIVEQLHRRTSNACGETGLPFQIIYVDDGSRDGTADWIQTHAIDAVDGNDFELENDLGSTTLLRLSRNFGQPSAILAGLKHSREIASY